MALYSGIRWQSLHSPVSGLAANHMSKEPTEDFSLFLEQRGTTDKDLRFMTQSGL